MKLIPPAVIESGLSAESPTYVYDLSRLREKCTRLNQLPITRKRVFFATMANDHPAILSCVRACGLGVFVNSMIHLSLVLKLGFQPRQVVYAASNMAPDEMDFCVQQGVNLVLDSFGQIQTLSKIVNGDLEIGLRLNVGSALDRGEIKPDPAYRFGLLPHELPDVVSFAQHHGLKITGAHSYFGTGLMEPSVLLDGMQRLGLAAGELPDLRYLDVGGGLGIPDDLDDPEFDIAEYSRGAEKIIRGHEQRLGRELELYIEPGRYLVADSGYFFVKVIDCKLREDRAFIGTNGSVSIFPRPLLYPETAHHPCQVITGNGQRPLHRKPVYVCGNSTYSQDFLARNITLSLPQPGDTLVFHHAGAYGRSMITQFLGKERPQEIVIESAIENAVSSAIGL